MKKLLLLVLATLLVAFSCLAISCDNSEESSSSESESESQARTERESQVESETETETETETKNFVTVKFDTQGGTKIDDVTVEKGEKASKPTDPKKAGYTFDGWYFNGEKWSFIGYVVTEDMTLVAKWTPVVEYYTITFEGKVTNSPIKYTSDDSFDLPRGIASRGYTFEGWFEDEALTKPISKIEKGTYGNKTIYAASFSEGLVVDLDGTVTGYTGTATEVIIPSTYNGRLVTSIGESAFKNCTSITSVKIPNSVISIEEDAFWCCTSLTSATIGNIVIWIRDYAFWGCDSLTSITIPNSVTSIGKDAFYSCDSLTSVTIGNSVTSIGDLAFCFCTKLTSVTIGDSVTSIGDGAFSSCTSLTSITIPDSVTSIEDGAFSRCTSLTSVVADENNTAYKSIDGNLYSKDGKTLVQYALGKKDTSFEIPNSVTSIGCHAFFGCASLTSITIPDRVTSIGSHAFYECTSLTSVTIGDGVTSIGDLAFYDCTSLTSVTIGNSVTSIGGRAFDGCRLLTSITIPNSVTSIGSYAFSCTSLTIYCEAQRKPIYWRSDWNPYNCPVVWDCNNNEVASDGYIYTIIDGIRYGIKDNEATVAEQPRNIKEAIIPESITYKGTSYPVNSIGDDAFDGCDSLTSVTIPNSVTSIGDSAFSGCPSLKYNEYDNALYLGNEQNPYLVLVKAKDTSITSCTINENTRFILNSAFYGRTSLTSVTIPDSVTSIGEDAFWNCDSLTIYCEATSEPSGWNSSWNYSNRPVYWYSESAPTTDGNFWHYGTNGEIVIW